MSYLTKPKKKELNKLGVETKNKISKDKIIYAHDQHTIRNLLNKGFKNRINVKIKYYSLSSDETRYREISIYYYCKEYIIAYCHLRKDIRTFVVNRINSVALLDKKYSIPDDFNNQDYVKGCW